MSFDYGVCEDKLGVGSYKPHNWPTTGEMTGLFDADTIPYVVGYSSTFEEYLKFKNQIRPFESDIWKSKVSQASYLIDSALSAAGCDSAIFYLTNSENNFRLDIGTVKKYKGQRKIEKPPFFEELKDWIHTYHNAIMSLNCEADDEISIEAWDRYYRFMKDAGQHNLFTDTHRKFIDFVIISKDKDLKIIPGLHHPPGDVKPLWVTPLGWLEPVYGENKIKGYSDWPLFDGKPFNPKNLFVMQKRSHGIFPSPYVDMSVGKNDKDPWVRDHVWCSINAHLVVKEQDQYSRGKNKGKGKFKKVETELVTSHNIKKLSGAGLSFFYAQLIMGDSVDNYPGLPGCGMKKAYEALIGLKNERSLANAVYNLYHDYYKTHELANEMMLEQGRLAHMQTCRNELWDFPCIDKSTFPTWAKAY